MNQDTRPNFPFSAVVGQARLKTALILSVIEPALNGVLISGPRGSAKSTLARGLADLEDIGREHFVTLPLGASEEQVIGTLDLQQALGEGRVGFQPGLIARADAGFLYIDEVNLLPDPLVDVLLDVAASGVNRVERDGISHAHSADFLLIGTMNPDEGELRPQLKDRFGLAVELNNRYEQNERREIVEQRLAFERDPAAYAERWQASQRELAARIRTARAALADVTCDDALKDDIARRCLEAGVEGVRADIHWRQAAHAHAAWQGRGAVDAADVDAVAEFVLGHRRDHRSGRESEPGGGSNAPPSGGSAGDRGGDDRNVVGGDWGAMPSRQVDPQPARPVSLERENTRPMSMHADESLTTAPSRERRAGEQRGYNRSRQTTARNNGPVDWFRTLTARENRGFRRIETLRYRPAPSARITLNCVLLDTSASTVGRQALAEAKGIVLGIAHAAYLAREQLAIMAFGNDRVEWVVGPQRAPRDCRSQLSALPAGGGTPLRKALDTARTRLQRAQRQQPGLRTRTLLLTDGRSRDPVGDMTWPAPLYVIDMERARVPLGRCRQLAERLGGEYLPAGLSLASASGRE